MNEVQIADALYGAVAPLAATLALPVAYPGVAFEPPESGKYLEVVRFVNTTASPTWGGEAVFMGILQVSLHKRNDNEGEIEAVDIQSQIAAAFYKNRLIYGDGGKVKIYQNPTALTPIVETDKTIYPVSIPYLASRREAG